jgi:hypothetical protein
MAKLPPWDDDKVIEQLRWMWGNGTIVKRQHFRDELKAAGASMLDIETIITGAPKVVGSEWDSKRRCYKYRISGSDVDDEILEFVVAFDTKNSKLFFITAF